MKIEILLVYLQNLSCLAGFAAVLLAAGLMVWGLIALGEFDDSDTRKNFYKALRLWPLLVVLTLIAMTPSPQDLWKVRISLIKLQLSSPENLNKASDEIERIGHKLECKYLGCDGDEKK